MGTSASTNPQVGVPVNPRVDYADERSKKEGKPMLIDAPVLVRLDHGTVRYRYTDKDVPQNKKQRTEKPHEGLEKTKKHDYFYHSTLNDFSEDAAYNKEESWKFLYVYKGPTAAKQKKVFYVSGRGLDGQLGGLVHPQVDHPQGKGYQWPAVFKVPNHAYYDLTFLEQNRDEGDSGDEDAEVSEDLGADTGISCMQMRLNNEDNVDKLKKRLALRLLKPSDQMHIIHKGQELKRPEDVIGDLHRGGNRRLTVKLTAI